MCNLSDVIEEKGRKLGALQGELQGKRENSLENAKNFLKNGVSMEIVKKSIPQLTDEDLERILEEIARENKGA